MSNVVELIVTWEEYFNCYSEATIDAKNRTRLNASFAHLMTHYLQGQQGINCSLVCNNNYVNKTKPFWSGKYLCSENMCTSQFHCRIDNTPTNLSSVTIVVAFKLSDLQHPLKQKNPRITGTKRLKMGVDIVANGLSNFDHEMNIKNFVNNTRENKCKSIFINCLSF
jgi:hypothetical protein